MRVLRLALVALLAIDASAPWAEASCNTIPRDPQYPGARGRTDRPFLSPDPDQRVTIHYGPGTSNASVQAIAQRDFVITLVFKPPGAKPSQFFIAPDDKTCRKVAKPVHGFARFFCHARRNCVTARDVGLDVDSAVSTLSFQPPITEMTGPVTIAISRFAHPLLGALQEKSCQEVLMSAQHTQRDADLAVCIDKLGAPIDDPPGDPLFPELLYLPPAYDYKSICTQHLGDPKCSGSANEVDFTLYTGGDVALRVLWGNILNKKTSDPNEFRRRGLLAGIAMGAFPGEADRIRIPGAAFLQTTTTQGGGFSPSPEFTPVEVPNRPDEQSFSGSADQGDSVLVFSRRKQWQFVCDGGPRDGHGCEPVTAEKPTEECQPGQCMGTLPWPGDYFACVGGNRAWLPCTSATQCGTGSSCEPVSTHGSVCYMYGGTPMAPQKTCFHDAECGKDAECGPGLFDFRKRSDLGTVGDSDGTIKRVASQTRGVCNGGATEGNVCKSNSACTTAGARDAKCVRYRASALLSESGN